MLTLNPFPGIFLQLNRANGVWKIKLGVSAKSLPLILSREESLVLFDVFRDLLGTAHTTFETNISLAPTIRLSITQTTEAIYIERKEINIKGGLQKRVFSFEKRCLTIVNQALRQLLHTISQMNVIEMEFSQGMVKTSEPKSRPIDVHFPLRADTHYLNDESEHDLNSGERDLGKEDTLEELLRAPPWFQNDTS